MFDHLPFAGLAAIFLFAAGVVWVAGLSLARTTETLTLRWKLGSALGGLMLLAVATNLPEIAIVLSGAAGGDASVAVGNILGGVAIQTVVIVALDAASRTKDPATAAPLTRRAASVELVLEAALVILVLALAAAGTMLPRGLAWSGIEPAVVLIVVAWVAGIWLISRARTSPQWRLAAQPHAGSRSAQTAAGRPKPSADPSRAGTGVTVLLFLLGAVATLGAGVALEQTGTAMADRLGLSGVLFGATVLAAATALPELSTGIASVRLKDDELAISDIFGGNAFLPVLLLPAGLLAGSAVLAGSGAALAYMSLLGIVVTVVYAAGLMLRPRHRVLGVGPDSLLVLVLYVVGTFGFWLLTRGG